MSMQLYKISYDYYEGEHEEILLAKDVETEQFDKDIIEAKDYAQSRIGLKYKKSEYMKPYNVEYLPEFYQTIADYLQEQKGYIEIHTNDDIHYEVDDSGTQEKEISVEKVEIHTVRKEGKPGGKFVPVNL